MKFRSVFFTIALGMASAGQAFDTGHHFDATRHCGRANDFGDFAIRVMQLQNWYVDYYSNLPGYADKHILDLLHFDNLDTTKKVRIYWANLTNNTRKAIQRAAKQGNVLRALTIAGMSLHAVQDFYTHSNWAERHPPIGSAYNGNTWFDLPPAANDTSIYTGSYPTPEPPPSPLTLTHGGYGFGLNHDAYGRPRFDEAYVFAILASNQWLFAIGQWVEQVRPGFFQEMRTYFDADYVADLKTDHYYLYRISEWTRKPGIPGESVPTYLDGKWKGEFSGALTTWAFVNAAFATYVSPFSLQFTDAKYYKELVPGLDNLEIQIPPSTPKLPTIVLNHRIVWVRTLEVADTNFFTVDAITDSVDFDTLADFFARLTVAGQEYTEACRQITRSGATNWLTLRMLPNSLRSVRISYALYDEDANVSLLGLLERDELCDVNPANRRRTLSMSFNTATHDLSGDITGVHDTAGTAFEIEGNESISAKIKMYVTEYGIKRS